VRPTRGSILFDERDVTDLPTEARNIAQVFQFPVVYDTMTVCENLAFPLKNRRVAPATVANRVAEIARLLELTRVLDRKARNLTADMKQKISLGRGLVRADVAAILFDEPLTVIDPHLKWQLRSTLKELHRALDLTMIYVTHDQTEALTFADKVVVMHDGAVVQTGTPDELFERPAHTFVGHFIGSPGMNVLSCRVEGSTAHVGDQAIALNRAYPALASAQRVELGIRPEFARLQPRGAGLPVQVKRIDDIGRARIARVEMAGRPLAASVPEEVSIEGIEAALALDPRQIHIYADGHLVAGEVVAR
jgi:glycerol transport system ATP-binding protein